MGDKGKATAITSKSPSLRHLAAALLRPLTLTLTDTHPGHWRTKATQPWPSCEAGCEADRVISSTALLSLPRRIRWSVPDGDQEALLLVFLLQAAGMQQRESDPGD